MIMKLPPHKASMTLTHNDHLTSYLTVQEAINRDDFGYMDWVSPEQRQKAIDTNECWFLQWYPNSPVGFHVLAAADLDILLNEIEKGPCLSNPCSDLCRT
jgi:hypothetical protein